MGREPFVWIGEWGFRFELWTGMDATDYDTATIYLRDPSGTVTSHTAATDDEATGQFYFAPIEGTFDVAGRWEIAIVISMGAAGVNGPRKSGPSSFMVGETLEPAP